MIVWLSLSGNMHAPAGDCGRGRARVAIRSRKTWAARNRLDTSLRNAQLPIILIGGVLVLL
jgi:hypothetical protein